jgi:uncharacterized Zn finger protein
MEIDCDRCGESFDTDRDGVAAGQDTSRCPACGKSYEVDDSDGSKAAAVSLGNDGGEVHIHVHVHRE